MKYISTRGNNEYIESAQAIKQGLANDGGLFIPETIPMLSNDDILELVDMSYIQRAVKILSLYLTDYSDEELKIAANLAYSTEKFGANAAPIKSLSSKHKILELWHGPTCAFKDMALQIMPVLLSQALKKTGEKRTALILVATSGDTGKAALEGYKDIDGVKIMVFYPEDGVSDIQKFQMTSQDGENVNVCATSGNFDDAQTGVKSIFSDKKIEEYLNNNNTFLSSANSINWGRLVPQIVYYISAYCDLIKTRQIDAFDEIDVCVPTGNFGNIFAAFLAKKMALPIRKLICASNMNNVLTDFIKTGVYDRNRDFHTTMSPSMDILISSNLERLLYILQGAEKTKRCMESLTKTGKYELDENTNQLIKETFVGCYATEYDTKTTIKNTFEKYNYLIDTHTAVAFFAANKEATDKVVLTVSTASSFKFSSDVLNALREDKRADDYFKILHNLNEATGIEIPKPLIALETKNRKFFSKCEKTKEAMWEQVKKF